MGSMALITPGYLHRVALAVDDAGAADEWFRRVLGAVAIRDEPEPGERRSSSGDEADLAGTDTRLFRLGGFPFILLSKGVPGGPVAKFLTRYGPAVHSLAWEVEDMWTTQNLLIQRGIRIGAVNIPGRHFFMHPKDTHSVLMEWTDDTFGANGGQTTSGGDIDVDSLAWVTAAVTDAEATAAFLTDLAGATPVDGNAKGPEDRELTIDLEVGDMTLRLVTPRSADSPYAEVLGAGARLCSYAMRVGDLDGTLKALDGVGVGTVRRDGDLAATDPASTFGVPMEWTS
jgi:catechol 2,3-dioxygenase-like lactoylglutathione lyase family enzyme